MVKQKQKGKYKILKNYISMYIQSCTKTKPRKYNQSPSSWLAIGQLLIISVDTALNMVLSIKRFV